MVVGILLAITLYFNLDVTSISFAREFSNSVFLFQMLIRPVDSCFLVKHKIQVPFVLFSNGRFMHAY